MPQTGPKIVPKSSQNGPKLVPRRPQEGPGGFKKQQQKIENEKWHQEAPTPKSPHLLGPKLDPKWTHVGSTLSTFCEHVCEHVSASIFMALGRLPNLHFLHPAAAKTQFWHFLSWPHQVVRKLWRMLGHKKSDLGAVISDSWVFRQLFSLGSRLHRLETRPRRWDTHPCRSCN